jgi:hypothetical protein
MRYHWCLLNKHNDFRNYVFSDESTLRVLEVPLYHLRRRGEHVSVPVTSKVRLKLNIWGAISTKGAPPVFVNITLLFLLN